MSNPILENFFNNTVTIKKMVYTTTSGKPTKTLSDAATGIRCAIQPTSGNLINTMVGEGRSATHRLFAYISDEFKPGRVIQDQDGIQYDIIHVAKQKFFAQNHHVEVLMEERTRNIA